MEYNKTYTYKMSINLFSCERETVIDPSEIWDKDEWEEWNDEEQDREMETCARENLEQYIRVWRVEN